MAMGIFGLATSDIYGHALQACLLMIVFMPLFTILAPSTCGKISQNGVLIKIRDINFDKGSDPVLVALPSTFFTKYPFLLSGYKPGILVYKPEYITLQLDEIHYTFKRDNLSIREDLIDSIILTDGTKQFLVKTPLPIKERSHKRTSIEQLQHIKKHLLQAKVDQLVLYLSLILVFVNAVFYSLTELKILSYRYPFIQNDADIANFNFWLVSTNILLSLFAFLALRHKNISMLWSIYVSILFGLSVYLFGGLGMFPLLFKPN